jgi:immune inhibitor A
MRGLSRVLSAAIVFVLLTGCLTGGAPQAAAEERSAPRDMAERLLNAPQPGRSPFDLAVRLRGLSAATPAQVPVPATPLVAGFQDTFWILDQRTAQLFQAQATLRLVTERAYWFVQNDMADRVLRPDLERSATTFESRTAPVIQRYFGALPGPGVDGDGHIVFLLGNVPGVAAYFSSADAYPRAINPRSNEHEMIYVNLNSLRPGQTGFDSTVTHELQHMAHFKQCPSQEGWVDEGASELAMRVAGYEGAPPAAFVAHPDTQLTTWSAGAADVSRHYQAAYLFVRYVAERAGGWDALPRLFASCSRGEGLFADFLTRQPIAPDVDTLFSDWTVANLVQDGSLADGRYAYAGGGFRAAITGTVSRRTAFVGAVPQFAANYLDLPAGGGTVTFNGDPSVPLLGANVDDGGVWWSNRGDTLDSRLTRSLDLREVSQATLRFRAWYDLEDQFDFVYLSASPDGGRTWRVLPGVHGRPDDATGNHYGPGWTGSSGDAWLDEEVDLSAFAGGQVLVRFEYVTDQSYNGQGFALRDVRVPEIGLDETGAVEGQWAAEGWVRVDAPIPERWNLRLARWTDHGTEIETVPVAADGSATVALDDAASRQVLIIAPTAPRTLIAGNYSVAIGP